MKKFKGLNVPDSNLSVNERQDIYCESTKTLCSSIKCVDCLFDYKNAETFKEWERVNNQNTP